MRNNPLSSQTGAEGSSNNSTRSSARNSLGSGESASFEMLPIAGSADWQIGDLDPSIAALLVTEDTGLSKAFALSSVTLKFLRQDAEAKYVQWLYLQRNFVTFTSWLVFSIILSVVVLLYAVLHRPDLARDTLLSPFILMLIALIPVQVGVAVAVSRKHGSGSVVGQQGGAAMKTVFKREVAVMVVSVLHLAFVLMGVQFGCSHCTVDAGSSTASSSSNDNTVTTSSAPSSDDSSRATSEVTGSGEVCHWLFAYAFSLGYAFALPLLTQLRFRLVTPILLVAPLLAYLSSTLLVEGGTYWSPSRHHPLEVLLWPLFVGPVLVYRHCELQLRHLFAQAHKVREKAVRGNDCVDTMRDSSIRYAYPSVLYHSLVEEGGGRKTRKCKFFEAECLVISDLGGDFSSRWAAALAAELTLQQQQEEQRQVTPDEERSNHNTVTPLVAPSETRPASKKHQHTGRSTGTTGYASQHTKQGYELLLKYCNDAFRALEGLAQLRDMEKVGTLGDSFLCGGFAHDVRRKSMRARNGVLFASDVLKSLTILAEEAAGNSFPLLTILKAEEHQRQHQKQQTSGGTLSPPPAPAPQFLPLPRVGAHLANFYAGFVGEDPKVVHLQEDPEQHPALDLNRCRPGYISCSSLLKRIADPFLSLRYEAPKSQGPKAKTNDRKDGNPPPADSGIESACGGDILFVNVVTVKSTKLQTLNLAQEAEDDLPPRLHDGTGRRALPGSRILPSPKHQRVGVVVGQVESSAASSGSGKSSGKSSGKQTGHSSSCSGMAKSSSSGGGSSTTGVVPGGGAGINITDYLAMVGDDDSRGSHASGPKHQRVGVVVGQVESSAASSGSGKHKSSSSSGLGGGSSTTGVVPGAGITDYLAMVGGDDSLRGSHAGVGGSVASDRAFEVSVPSWPGDDELPLSPLSATVTSVDLSDNRVGTPHGSVRDASASPMNIPLAKEKKGGKRRQVQFHRFSLSFFYDFLEKKYQRFVVHLSPLTADCYWTLMMLEIYTLFFHVVVSEGLVHSALDDSPESSVRWARVWLTVIGISTAISIVLTKVFGADHPGFRTWSVLCSVVSFAAASQQPSSGTNGTTISSEGKSFLLHSLMGLYLLFTTLHVSFGWRVRFDWRFVTYLTVLTFIGFAAFLFRWFYGQERMGQGVDHLIQFMLLWCGLVLCVAASYSIDYSLHLGFSTLLEARVEAQKTRTQLSKTRKGVLESMFPSFFPQLLSDHLRLLKDREVETATRAGIESHGVPEAKKANNKREGVFSLTKTLRQCFAPITKVGIEFGDEQEEDGLDSAASGPLVGGSTELGTDDPTTLMDRVLLQCLNVQRLNYGITTWYQPNVSVAFLHIDCSSDRQHSVRRVMEAHQLISRTCLEGRVTKLKAVGDQMLCTCGLDSKQNEVSELVVEEADGDLESQHDEERPKSRDEERPRSRDEERPRSRERSNSDRLLIHAVRNFMLVLAQHRYIFSIGLGVGPTVAGVFGRNSLWYDVLGPAVESAKKMSMAVPADIGLRCSGFEEADGGGLCIASPQFQADCPGCFSEFEDISSYLIPASAAQNNKGLKRRSSASVVASSAPPTTGPGESGGLSDCETAAGPIGHLYVLDHTTFVVDRVLHREESS